jgi:ribosome biogenesis GTPase
MFGATALIDSMMPSTRASLRSSRVTLVEYGWDDHLAALARDAGGEVGRIVRVDRGVHTVITEDGERATSLSGALKDTRDPVDRPAIGDWVLVDGDDVINEVLPRHSEFLRGDFSRLQAQVVAANVDVVFVVHAADDDPNPRRLERELVLAWQSGATPVLVVNKADVGDADTAVRALAPCAPDVDVVVTSAKTGLGLDLLAAYGSGNRTLALIGASGVGKSTLVNALLGEERQATGATRETDNRGRHTTVARALFLLPTGGVLIDTPGLRSVGLWRSDEGLALAFRDIEELGRSCRFADCTHDHEPGCAVRDVLDADRLASWRRLQDELDRLDAEAEARGRVVKQQQRQEREARRALRRS